MTDAPDTNELLLRDVEAAVARARTAMDAGHSELVALNMGFVQMQALRLTELLGSRIVDPAFRGLG